MAAIVVILFAGCANQATIHHDDLAMQKAEIAAQSFCEHIMFSSLADCVRGQFDQNYPLWQGDSNADLVQMFLNWVGAASARIARGEMAEAEGWEGAHTLYGRLHQLAVNRYQAQLQAQQINSQQAATLMYAGLALLSLGQQQQAPSAMISCQGHWVGRYFYTNCQ